MDHEKRKYQKAFEMWIWRRLERISWMEHRTNEEILQLGDEKRSLTKIIRDRQRSWLGHIMRGDSLLRTRPIIEGRMAEKKKTENDVTGLDAERGLQQVEGESWRSW